MKSDRRHTRRIGAWIGALAVSACTLAAMPVSGQVATIRLDLDATEERHRAFGEQLEAGTVEVSSRPMIAQRAGAPGRLALNRFDLRPGFWKGHLLPRMSRRLGDVASIHTLETQPGRFENSGLHDRVSDTVERQALRATRKAAKAYLLEQTPIGAWLESPRVTRHGGGRNARQRAMNFGFDLSHGIPKVGIRHRAAVGTTRFKLGLDGSVRLEFRPAHSTRTLFYAGYEAEMSGYRLAYRLAF